MDRSILGLHHVTAITADAQRNVDFYAGVLGLRLVKLTVNFDDPTSYHLYYGDELGRPGSIITFFAWPGAFRGRIGPPQVSAVSFSVPRGSLPWWAERLKKHVVIHNPKEEVEPRLDEEVLAFSDPDGLRLELSSSPREDPRSPWDVGLVDPGKAIRGISSVTLSEEGYEHTALLLTERLGFRPVASHGNRFRYEVGAGGPGATVDLLCLPDGRGGSLGTGTVHHVAWRVRDDEGQSSWRREIAGAGLNVGLNVSPVMDRVYFHSIYFREPGGILFEIATDAPGFQLDEPAEQLGTRLMLPPWLEPTRARLEWVLPPLNLPSSKGRLA